MERKILVPGIANQPLLLLPSNFDFYQATLTKRRPCRMPTIP